LTSGFSYLEGLNHMVVSWFDDPCVNTAQQRYMFQPLLDMASLQHIAAMLEQNLESQSIAIVECFFGQSTPPSWSCERRLSAWLQSFANRAWIRLQKSAEI
jgi:hypothetical protein